MNRSRVVLVPGVLALLPEYAGLSDPVAELRAGCLAAVAWLVEDGPVAVVASGDRGRRVARHLLGAVGSSDDAASGNTLVIGNGSARRTEKAPGHLDERAAGFDTALEAALCAPDAAALSGLDGPLGDELLADTQGLRALGDLLAGASAASVDYADDPFGVQYWVMRWTCGS